MKITLCVITLNEENNLRRCLSSVQNVADEIVILDSGSTDATKRIAEEFGARFEVQPWLGYGAQKNKALSFAKTEWILSLDADEALSEPLRREILALRDTSPDVEGFSISRCVFFEEKWIRHGDWYPDRVVRLFKKNRARFTSSKVHERLEVEGKIALLRGEIEHYSFRDAADHLARGEKYAKLWAESQAESGRKVDPWDPFTRAAFKLIRGYCIKGGFLDGSTGWGIAWRNAREVYLKYSALRSKSN